jgi:carbon starvation protein CstA
MTTAFLVFATSTVLSAGVALVVTMVEVEKLQSSGVMTRPSNPAMWVFSAVDLFTIDLSNQPADVKSKFLSARRSVASILRLSAGLAVVSLILLILAVSQRVPS